MLPTAARTALRALAFSVLLFALLEASARVYLFGLAGLIPARINSVHGLFSTGYLQRSPLRQLGFEFRPNIEGHFKLVPFRTNSQGLRDREYDLVKPEDTVRVAVIGSSYALPAGVEIEAAFHSLLETQLSERLAPTRYEFVNFAVGAYGPGQMLAMLELRALAYEPDLVLFTATPKYASLLLRPPVPPPELRPELLRRSYPILQSFLLRLVRERTGHGPDRPQLQTGLLERAFMAALRPWSAPVPPAKTLAKRTAPSHGNAIERLSRLGRERGIPIAIIRLDFDAAPAPPDDRIAEQARALGLLYLDTSSAFEGTRASDFWIYELDPHPNEKAHALFAREIAEFLESHGLLPR